MNMDRPTIRVLGFSQTYEKDRATGNMTRPVDWVEYTPVHTANTTIIKDRVDNLRPPKSLPNDEEGQKMTFLRYRWEMIEPAYRAWKEGIEIPENGTPLGVWPGINEAQAMAFRAVGVRTVEDVANMSEAEMSRAPLPGVRELCKQAKAFLDASDRSSTANQLSELKDQNKALAERLEAAMELLEQQTAPDRRGPGRPRKEVAEAA